MNRADSSTGPSSRRLRLAVLSALLALAAASPAVLLSGCVSRQQALAEVRAAYEAGQQDALRRLQQIQGPSVLVSGPVRNPVVPWTPDLTVAKTIVSAQYLPPNEPAHIVIIRNGEQIPVDPKTLLKGEDVPVQSGDEVRLEP